MTGRRALLGLALAGILAGNLWTGAWHDRLYTLPGVSRNPRAEILLGAIGEARLLVARSLWFKMDLYHEILDEQGVVFTEEREVVPFLRMILTLDPTFVDAYDVAAYDLFVGYKKPQEALAILDEGLRYNPDSRLLWFRKAFFLFELERWAEVLAPAEKALALAQDEFQALDAIRLTAHSLKPLGRRSEEIRYLQGWLNLRPKDDYPLKRLAELGG